MALVEPIDPTDINMVLDAGLRDRIVWQMNADEWELRLDEAAYAVAAIMNRPYYEDDLTPEERATAEAVYRAHPYAITAGSAMPAINVEQATVDTHLSATLYRDGLLQISTVGDFVLAETKLDDPTPNTDSAHKALQRMLGEVAMTISLQIEGRDFDLTKGPLLG
jgi:hypothetical protein